MIYLFAVACCNSVEWLESYSYVPIDGWTKFGNSVALIGSSNAPPIENNQQQQSVCGKIRICTTRRF